MNTKDVKGERMSEWNRDIIIYPRLGKLVVLSTMFVVIGIILIVAGISEADTTALLIVVGTACTVFFGLCLVYLIFRWLQRSPALIVNEQGIIDHSSWIQGGQILWNDILDIVIYTYGSQKFIGIVLRDPQAFLDAQSILKRSLIKINVKMMNTHVNIAQSALPIALEELYEMIRYRWRNAQTKEL